MTLVIAHEAVDQQALGGHALAAVAQQLGEGLIGHDSG